MFYSYHPYSAARPREGTLPPMSAKLDEDRVIGDGGYQAIVAKAKSMHRNNSIAESVTTCILDYHAGTGGLTPISNIEVAANYYRTWAKNCDSTKTLSMGALFRNIVKAQVEEGDVLLLLPLEMENGKYKTRVQVVSGAKVSTPYEIQDGKTDGQGRKVSLGVAYSPSGEEVGYYVEYEPSKWRFYDRKDPVTGRALTLLARNARPLSPGQSRGLPWITKVIADIEDVSTLFELGLQQGRSAAALGVLIETSDPTGAATGLGAIAKPDPNAPSVTWQAEMPTGGAVGTVPFGSKVHTVQSTTAPERDTQLLRGLKLIAAGTGIPYPLLLRDHSDHNFSSSKMAGDSLIRTISGWDLVNGLMMTEIANAVAWDGYLNGEITTNPNFISWAWFGERTISGDEVKYAKGVSESIAAGVTTWSAELQRRGQNLPDYLKTRAAEIKAVQAVATEMGLEWHELMPTWQPEPIDPEPNEPTPPGDPNAQDNPNP